MKIKAQKGKISPIQLFFIFFVSRTIVCLNYVQSVSFGTFSTDILFSLALSYFATLIFSIPVIFCIKKGKSIFDFSIISLLYAVYFVLFSSITVSRFSYFAVTKMNTKMAMFVFIILAFLAAGYGAYLGLESLARFGGFCGVVLIVATFVVVAFNIKNFNVLNLYPVFENTKDDFLLNSLLFSCNTIEPALFLTLYPSTNGKQIKPYLFGISSSYLVIFLLLLFCCGVLGNNANFQSFPIFTLFSLASFFDVSRLEVFHTAFWIFALFLKTAILLLSATVLTKKFQHKTKIIVLSICGIIMSLLINYLIETNFPTESKIVTIVSFAVFILVLPIAMLLKKRGKTYEEN